MDKDIPITKHIFRPHCWVCKKKFDHQRLHEDHHIIPCAYGGVDGPQVRICSSHHTALHTIALRLYNGKPFFELLSSDPETNERLLYLATVVHNARVAVENDPNKKRVIVLGLRKETFERMRKLKAIYRKSSQQKLIEIALEQLYHKHFH